MNNYKYMFKKLYKINHFSRLYKYNDLLIKKVPMNNKLIKYDNEFNILRNFDSEFIIKIKESYEDTDYFYTVMDYYSNKDIYENIKNRKISIDKDFINKIIKPIEIIHSQNIVHLDIKLENYLLNDNNDFTLIDFQWSKNHSFDYYHKIELYNKKIYGTECFMAPEFILNKEYCKSTDIYSIGCLLFLVYTRKLYDKNNLYLLDNLSFEIKNLIVKLLDYDYKKRPTVYEIKNYLI